MDCEWTLLKVLLTVVAVPMLMALGWLTFLLWHMLRGHGGWK